MLFLIYINDIVNVIVSEVTVKPFEDDRVLYVTAISRADQTILNDNLDKLLSCCGAWGMDLNIDDCSTIRICNRKAVKQYSYSM